MIPAKNRDRKCSTCRHYQPSPLWRKGWCRNPLLYDRNTNHLVEADSLACNRTFIDYWEPIQGPTPEMAPQARSGKPRIAPSIPMGTMDAQGNRAVTTGNTPAAGMAAVAEAAATKPERDVPKLALVTPDYEPHEVQAPEAGSKVTRQIEQVPAASADAATMTTRERIRQARKQNRFVSSTGGRIVVVAAVVAVLLVALAGAFYLLNRNNSPSKAAASIPTTVVTRPIPTPTGLGDATATPVATAAPVLPAAGVIGVNGWVQVKSNGGLSMRADPKKTGKKLAVLTDGTKAHVVDGPTDADGFTWWKLDVAGKGSGWSAGQYLVAIPAPK